MNGADEGRDEILGDLGSKSEATRQPKSRKAGCWPKTAPKGVGVKSKRMRREQTALIQIGVDRAVRRKEIAYRLPTRDPGIIVSLHPKPERNQLSQGRSNDDFFFGNAENLGSLPAFSTVLLPLHLEP